MSRKTDPSPSWQDVFEMLPDAVLLTDPTGNVVLANSAAGQLIGISPSKLQGRNVGDLVREGVYQRSIAMEAIQAKNTITGMIKTPAGLAAMSTSVPQLDPAGNVRYVISISRSKAVVD